MKFTGRIQKVLPMTGGISQKTGNEWKKLSFIFQYFEKPTDWYSDSVVIDVYNDSMFPSIVENANVIVDFRHKTREYDGRYFNEVRVQSIEFVPAQPTARPQSADEPIATIPAPAVPQPQEGGQENDDLPF